MLTYVFYSLGYNSILHAFFRCSDYSSRGPWALSPVSALSLWLAVVLLSFEHFLTFWYKMLQAHLLFSLPRFLKQLFLPHITLLSLEATAQTPSAITAKIPKWRVSASFATPVPTFLEALLCGLLWHWSILVWGRGSFCFGILSAHTYRIHYKMLENFPYLSVHMLSRATSVTL